MILYFLALSEAKAAAIAVAADLAWSSALHWMFLMDWSVRIGWMNPKSDLGGGGILSSCCCRLNAGALSIVVVLGGFYLREWGFHDCCGFGGLAGSFLIGGGVALRSGVFMRASPMVSYLNLSSVTNFFLSSSLLILSVM